MRTFLIGLATGTAAIALPAQAKDGAAYLGLEGGVATASNLDFETDDGNRVASADLELGSDAGVLLGYDFGRVRAELDGSWKRFNLSSLSGSVPIVGTFEDVGGKVDAWAGMANVLLDLGNDRGLSFSVGGGAGFAKLDFKNVTVDSAGPGFLDSSSDTRFAWQGIAMVRAPFNDRIDFAVKYRYFNVSNAHVADNAGRALTTDFSSHSLLGTAFINFGGRQPVSNMPVFQAPPAPPPPPPPPPPPQIIPPPPKPNGLASCNVGPYIAFFDFDSDRISPEAATVLDTVVTASEVCGTSGVELMLAGYTDRSGSTAYNLGLAERRAQATAEYLTARGIPGAIITTEAFGESDPRVPTADGVREAQNRRVELTFGPGSGQ